MSQISKEADYLKEAKLFLYISSSLLEYQQGNKSKMNQFLDEISNRNKPEASLRLWTKALIRIILEKRLPITSFLAISTLKKAPWLFSESHLKIFDLFEKFLLTVLSLYNQHLPLVYKYLFEQILFEEKEQEPKKGVSIQGKAFASQEELLFYIRAEILGNKKYEKKLDSSIIPLEEEDSCFMQEVFKSHRHYETKFASFSQLGVGEFPSKEKKTRCFFVCGGQGKSVDISYLKTVQYLFENLRPEAFLPNNMRRVGLVADLTAKLLQIYPLSRNSLLELLAEGFPHKRRGEGLLELYLFFLLLLCLRIPALEHEILVISFEKLIGLDVEIKLDKQAPENNDENARKLDALMSVMFQFLEYRFKNIESPSDNIFKRMESNEIMEKNTNNIDNTINPNNSEDNKNVKTHNIDKKVSLNGNHNIITSLLKLFREKLLLVYQSKYVQFLHFYMVSFLHNYPQALEEFLSILIASSLSQSNAKLIRLNSISYLSSFLSRATYIPKDLLLKSIGFLLDFLDEFELEEDIGDIGLLQRKSLLKQQKEEIVFIPNEAFVLVLQGILYIFCYQKELLLEKGLACRLEKIMVKTKEFMRLEWVSKEVLDEFLIICENSGGQEGILAVLKDRKDILMDKKQKELFYPFDPYLLKRSEGFIRELYRFWNNERPEEGRKLECEKETDSSSPYIKENEEDKKRKLDEIETGEEKEFEVSLKKKIKK